ncbi:hypothetical protein H4R33_005589 [Dimargaris cristalligena]|nr:hypothetical protein H4R33_005589 [Dimargaris cristalligena]
MSSRINRRFEYQGARGTLRYEGPVAGTPDLWLGVEWDDPTRGKHDGSKGGVRYFTTATPTAGSFLRPHLPLRWGQTFLEALVQKYLVTARGQVVDRALEGVAKREELVALAHRLAGPGSSSNDNSNSTPNPEAASSAAEPQFLGDSGVAVQTCGWDRAQGRFSQLHTLRTIGLANQAIDGLGGDAETITSLCPAAEELDLSRNLLRDWADLWNIAQALPSLRLLRANDNNIGPETVAFDTDQHKSLDLGTVALNHTQLHWPQIISIARQCPQLQTLSVGFNGITRLGSVLDTSIPGCLSNHLQALRHLSLEGNGLSAWSEIAPLGQLPNLTSLDLQNNELADLFYPTESSSESSKVPFRTLVSLNINGNRLASWAAVDQLDKFPQLSALRFRDNPVVEGISVDRARLFLVGHLAKITMLNGSEVKKRERTDIELYYLKLIAEEFPALDADVISANHPRYRDLVALHGLPNATKQQPSSDTLASRVIELTIQTGSPKSTSQPMVTLTKRVIPTITIRDFRTKCGQLLQMPGQVEIYHENADSEVTRVVGRNFQTLEDCGFQSGDTMWIAMAESC